MKKNSGYIHWLIPTVFITIVTLCFVVIFCDFYPLKNGLLREQDLEKDLSTKLNKIYYFIGRTNGVTQLLNDLLAKTNKIGDLIEEKYANVNPANEKDTQRINDYRELMGYLGTASAKLRESIALLPEALTMPINENNLSPIKDKLAEAKFILDYIQVRMSD